MLTTPLDEKGAAAGGGFLAWTQNGGADRRHFDVYARRGAGPAFKVNRPGTQARTGGIDGTKLVYQEIVGGRSDLRLYDLARRRSLPLRDVNTKLWEMRPTLSGRWLLFGRIDYATRAYAVVLHDLVTGRERRLDVVARSHRPDIEPGQVNGRYAVWATGVDIVYNVYRFDAVTGRTVRLPGPNQYRVPQFGPSVSRTGIVYFGRSGLGCGESVRLMRAPLHGPITTLAVLPAGKDLETSYALDAGGRTTVFYDRADCERETFDIYKAIDPARP